MKVFYENLKLVNAAFEEELKQKFNAVLDSGRYVLGREVEGFEQEFRTYLQADFCVGVSSGLDALTLGITALDLPPGSEILVASNAYIACMLSIIKSGHKPVLVEPQLSSRNIDPERIINHITPDTRAVMAVHLYGNPCDMAQIQNVCQKHGLQLIEDCAQSHGAAFNGQLTGTFGDVAAFSFYPTKNLGALGEAGAIICKEAHIDQKLRSLRNYGFVEKNRTKYIGSNARLDELQAAFLRVKLKHLDTITKQKRALADLYFSGLPKQLDIPQIHKKAEPVFHAFNVLSDQRDALKQFLKEKGIQTEIHYPIPPHKQEGYKHFFSKQPFPISEKIHANTLSLPISFAHSAEDITYVIDSVNAFFKPSA